MFLDQRKLSGGPGYSFHGYTEGGYLSGFHLRENVIAGGRFILGGGNEPHHHNVVDRCYFYNIPNVEFGYRRPIQVQFSGNYLGRSCLETDFFWGGGGQGRKGVTKPLPNVYTGNTIVNPPGRAIIFRTTGYLDGQRADGKLRIDTRDVFNNNVYTKPFKASLAAAGRRTEVDFAAWRKETAAAGKAFDANSRVVPAPTSPYAAVLANTYEPGRGHVVVYNWPKAAKVKVDLSTVVAKGQAFTIHKAKDAFGKPVAAGLYTGPVDIPTAGREFAAFLVRARDRR